MPKSTAMVRAVRPRRRKAVRAYGRVRGHGDYSYDKPGPWGKFGRVVGGMLGAKGGGMLGARYGPSGSKVGELAGRAAGAKLGSYLHYIGKIFGSGDYVTSADQVKHNVLVSSNQIPSFSGNKNEVHVRHREFICNIVSSATANTFNVQSFPINPGLNSSFPWLAGVCGDNFQQYRVNGMVFEYRSLSADAIASSTNTTLGSVIMATDYDSKDAAFSSKAQMENTEFGVSCKPSCSMIHAIECARTQTSVSEQYVRAGAVPSGSDVRLYDLGLFSIATDGFQGTSVVAGELWVSYDISLLKAYQGIAGAVIPVAHYQCDPATMATAPCKFLTTGTKNIDTIGLTTSDGLNIAFPYTIAIGSQWFCWWIGAGTSTASVTPITFGGSHGMTKLGIANANQAGTIGFPAPAATATAHSATCILRYDGGGTPALPPTLAVSVATTPLSAYSYGDLYIMQINGNTIF